jgi:ElaB/YqjD/DUF883 family membrane-anchored ribosome-binding protein
VLTDIEQLIYNKTKIKRRKIQNIKQKGEREMKKVKTNSSQKPVEIKEDQSILESINDYYSRN